MKTRYRYAVPNDHTRIFEMASRFLQETPYAELFDAKPDVVLAMIDLGFDRMRAGTGVIIVAEVDGGELVGMIGALLGLLTLTGEQFVDEAVWWVEPEHRQHSRIGPQLLAQLERWAIAKNVFVVKMVAPTQSLVGRYLQHRGYSAVEQSFIKRLR